MKFIVTGASGFLGREVALAAARRGHRVIAIGNTRAVALPASNAAVQKIQLDLRDAAGVERLLLDEFPDAVVNCAAIATIDDCRAAPDAAGALNTDLPRRLALLVNHLSARLIHISTDMVFDGERGNYANTAAPAPLHLYGRTKLAGEIAALEAAAKFTVVLRAPLLSGNSAGGTHSLHERLLTQWARGEQTPLNADEIRQPVSAANLADVAVELCERPNLSGVYHWAGTEPLSRLEIGRRIAARFALDAAEFIAPATLAGSTTGAWRRPRDLSLDLQPLRGKLRTPAQNFDTLLAEMRVPDALAPWLAAKTGVPTTPRRLVLGEDF